MAIIISSNYLDAPYMDNSPLGLDRHNIEISMEALQNFQKLEKLCSGFIIDVLA
jgi:hypothetical protein